MFTDIRQTIAKVKENNRSSFSTDHALPFFFSSPFKQISGPLGGNFRFYSKVNLYMRIVLLALLGFILGLGVTSLQATHIVGAELYYTCIDSANSQYEITLKIYRDCDRGQANFDDPIDLFVFDGLNGQRMQIISIPKPANTPKIAPENWDACVGSPYTICVEEGIYRDTITLLPNFGGYDLAWARCCRNSAITNLDDPLGEGVTFLAHVPAASVVRCNSMPTFDQVPPVFLCAQQPFNFDHSATDPDGDSLVYRFTDPYRGLDLNGDGAGNNQQNPGDPPPIVSLTNPMGPPPYQTVDFAPGYSFISPFGAGPASIDSRTGFLSVVPPTPGIFVIAISVFEYRNGRLLSEQRRDFQIHVVACIPQGDPPVITHDLSSLRHNGDTVCIEAKQGFCYPVTVTDVDTSDVLRAYVVSAEFNNGATFSWGGKNPIRGFVCWEPPCEYTGSIVPLIIGARDTGDCPNVADVFDTVWVKVLPAINLPPVITVNLNGLTLIDDTICVMAEDTLCIPFLVTDPNTDDSLRVSAHGAVFADAGPPLFNYIGVNPLVGHICWTPACRYKDQLVTIVLEAMDRPECADSAIVYDTIYIKVKVPPNLPPAITTDFGATPRNGDTLLIIALDSFCVDFRINDPDAGDELTAFPASPIFQQPDGPSFTSSGTNPVIGQICWSPSCAYQGQVIPFIFGGADDARCNTDKEVRDTFFVKISIPPNLGPTGWHDLSLLPNVHGDTIVAEPTVGFCYPVSFNDPDLGDSLTVYTLSPVFDTASNPPVIDVRGTNPLSIDICWTPGCEYQGMTIPLVLRAEDNGKCNNQLHTLDTVWVYIPPAVTLPPRIKVDFGSLNTQGDTIYMWVDDSICYDVTILDKSPGNGIRTEYHFESADGSRNLGYGNWSFRTQGDSVVGRICLKAPCTLGGGLYRMRINAIDLPKCPPHAEAEKIVYVRVSSRFLSFAGRDTFFCHGEGGVRLAAIPLGGVPPYQYLWTCDDAPNCGLSSPYDSIPTANPSQSTTFSVQITDSRGCKSEVDGVGVTIRPKPVVDAGPDQTICEGSAGVVLRADIVNRNESPGPYIHQWSPAHGLTDSTKLRPIARPESTTIYTLIVSDISTGCSSFTTTIDPLSTTIVRVKERPVVDAGPDRIVCFGDSVPLLGKATKAALPYQYVWTPAIGVNFPGRSTPNVSPPHTYTYFLVAWSQGCPSIADSVTVHVRTLPTADAGNHFEVCEGESLQLAGLAGGDSTATYTYDWTPGIYLDDSTAQRPIATPLKDIQYTVIATSSHGCVSPPYMMNLRLAPRPIAHAGVDFPWVCEGDSIELMGSYTWAGEIPPAGNPYYTWTPADQMDNRHLARPKVAPTSSTVYLLRTTYLACSSEDSVSVEVYPRPELKLALSQPVICGRDSLKLIASGGNGAATYSWRPAPGLKDTLGPIHWVKPQQHQWYIATIQEGACKTVDSIMVPVYYRPDPTVDHSAIKGCAPFEVSLSARSDSALYIWEQLNEPVLNAKDIFLLFNQPGEYPVRLTVIGEGGCADTSDIHLVQVSAPPKAAFITNPPLEARNPLPVEVECIDMSEHAVSWLWDFGQGELSTDPVPTIKFVEPGTRTIMLTVQDKHGCTDTAQLGPFELFSPDWFIPNVFTPNGDGSNDRFGVVYDGKGNVSLQVYDRQGRLVFEGEATWPKGWDGRLPKGGDAPEGTYYYSIRVQGQTITGWVVLFR